MIKKYVLLTALLNHLACEDSPVDNLKYIGNVMVDSLKISFEIFYQIQEGLVLLLVLVVRTLFLICQ